MFKKILNLRVVLIIIVLSIIYVAITILILGVDYYDFLTPFPRICDLITQIGLITTCSIVVTLIYELLFSFENNNIKK